MRKPTLAIALSTLSGVLLALSGCVTQRELPAFDTTQYGLGACAAEVKAQCDLIANRTFQSYGPRQIEYHAADGRAYLWVGNRIVKGYWKVAPGDWTTMGTPKLCYWYEDRGTNSDCNPMGNKGTHPEAYRQGDVYALATRGQAPFNLSSVPFNSGWEAIDAEYAKVPQG